MNSVAHKWKETLLYSLEQNVYQSKVAAAEIYSEGDKTNSGGTFYAFTSI